MDIIFYHPALTVDNWLQELKQAIPQACIRQWTKNDEAPAAYA